MKTEELDKLKTNLDELGFEYIITDTNKDQIVMIIQKKDPWEGVEFFECGGEIIKLGSYDKQKNVLVVLNGSKFHETNCKPSTEQSYIEQLKKEAFERFGEIKVGDRFDRTLLNVDGDLDNIITITDFIFGFEYYKDADSFEYNGNIIYQQGKWATKIERVEVTKSINYHNIHTDEHHFAFHISKKIENGSNVHSFLTKQLTKYLNNENTKI